MSAGGAGPAALLIGGGRASLGGEPLDPGGARRYRELTQGAGVPTYVLPGPGDLPNGGAEAFASAFATAPAPQGTGDAPAGVDLLTVTQPEARGRRPGAEHVRVRRPGIRGHRPGHRHRQRRGPARGRARRSAGPVDPRDDGAGAPGRLPLDRGRQHAAGRQPDREARRGRRRRDRAARGPCVGLRRDRRRGRPCRSSTSAACWLRASSRRPAPTPRSRCSSPRRSATRRPRTSRSTPMTEEALPPDERRAADDRRRRRPLGPEHRGRPRRGRVRAAPAGPGARSGLAGDPARLGDSALRHGQRPQPAALPDVAGPGRAAPTGEPRHHLRPADRPVPVLPASRVRRSSRPP